jgi:hypothetical protein
MLTALYSLFVKENKMHAFKAIFILFFWFFFRIKVFI